jgi:protoporphyrin/coproporphyrin ferrochelatase
LYNLFADPDIIRLPGPLSPLQAPIAYFISKRRAPKSRAAYESIGGGSPILRYSRSQADLICQSLKDRYNMDVKAYIGMRYWHPFTEEALDRIRQDGIQALVILPLYPQFSISTSGSSLRILQEEFSKNAHKYTGMVHTVVPSWYNRPGYVRAMTNLLQTELDLFTPTQIAEALQASPSLKPLHVLFSAHGVPQSYIAAGDPYQDQILQCVETISAQLDRSQVEVHLSYQSRVGPIEWLRPYTDDVLPELGQSGVRNLVVVPISFVSEHIETLEEIDIEYRELAEESGITNWRRCPALNTDPAFIQDMADIVVEALSEPAQTVTEACVANMVGDVELQSVDERLGINTGGVQGVGAEGGIRAAESKLRQKERINARVAMLGVLTTLLIELFSGKSITHIFGF